jgi:hypothetical protein
VSERGRIRLDRVVASLARRPGDLISASRLRRSGDAAMERVTTLIENVIATPRHE